VKHRLRSKRTGKCGAVSCHIKKAASIIKDGGLVAFPTETVYGLGADGFNADAVARIYAAKGRPNDNPLILHIASMEQFFELADNPPEYAIKLAQNYWPGPLTLVAKKQSHLPPWVGGHPNNSTKTVGIRIPNHPVALALIQAAGRPIAAPSANKAGKPSPTSAAHVVEDYPNCDYIDMIIDFSGNSFMRAKMLPNSVIFSPATDSFRRSLMEGKTLEVGVESTVIDITGETPVILRPGAITAEMIQQFSPLSQQTATTDTPRAPGMKYRHYAPQAEMIILNGTAHAVAAKIIFECGAKRKDFIGALVTKTAADIIKNQNTLNIHIQILSENPQNIAQELFAQLRKFDKTNVTTIYAQAVPDDGIGTAIMDRMRKAADGKIIDI